MISIKYPIKDSPDDKLFDLNKLSIDDVKSSIYFVLSTRKGERWMNPDFGCDFYEYLFDLNDQISYDSIINSIKRDIKSFVSNVEISNVEILPDYNEKLIDIRIIFSYSEANSVKQDTLLYTIQL